MSEQTAHLVDRLRARLRATLRRLTLADLAVGALVTLGAVAAAWGLAAALEAGLWLAPTPRTALFAAVAVLAAGLAVYFVGRPLGRLTGLLPTPSDEDVARTVGRRFPEVGDRLVNLLDLADGRRSAAPDAMVDGAVRRLGQEVQPVPFETAEDFARVRRVSPWALAPVAALLVFVLAAPSTFFGASQRLLAPGTYFQRPAPFRLSVAPGDTELVKGDSLAITARAVGTSTPRTLTLRLQNDGEERVETIELAPGPGGAFRHTVPSVRQTLRYRVAAAPVATAWHTARVTERPLVRTLRVTLTPPAYTGLPARTLDANVGDLVGLPGTRVDLGVRLGGPTVTRAQVRFDDGTTDTLAVKGARAEGGFTLRREGAYRVDLTGEGGVTNRDPIRYTMKLRADARPSVVFLAPEPEANLTDALRTQLRVRLSDDYGFSRLRLYYRLAERRFGAGVDDFAHVDLPLERRRQLDQEVGYDWLVAQTTGYDLVPGDVVEYYVQVRDNDAVAGYKAARTATQRLRLPSLTEQYDRLDDEQDSVENDLERLQEESETISDQFRELRDELRREQEADWEDTRQLDQIERKQEAVQERVQELSRQMQEITREMQQNSLTSPETSQLYEELQRVMEEVNDPAMQEALDKLRESMQNLDMRQMQEALEQVEFNEEQYQERLRRTLDLFKQIRANQKLDELARRAEELRQLQERLAEETAQRDEAEEAPEAEAENAEAEAENADEANNDEANSDETDGQTPDDAEASEDGAQADGEQEDADAPEGSDASEESEASDDSNASDDGETPNGNKPSPQNPQPSTNEDLAQEQERASEQMRELERQLQELAQQMQDMQAAPQQQMQELQQQLQEQNLPQQMQQNSQQMRQGQMQDAQQGQQQMQQQLQQMRQRLQQMQASMQGQQQQINMQGLRRALDNTLQLSQQQEALRRQTDQMANDSPTLRRMAQQQQQLREGMRTVGDSLRTLARQIPQMSQAVQRETGDALREMSQATESLSQRNARRGTGHQKGSMTHMNELALLLSDLMQQMQQQQQGGGGGGMSMQQMMQQMQQMSGQQQKLNAQMQQLLNDMQGNRLSVDQQQRLQQLAEQQARLKEQLDELSQEENAGELMGDLEKIAEEMEETINELQQNRQGRETIDRQRRILTRLLNAQKSLRTQGKKEEREGRTQEGDLARETPDALTPQEQADRLRRDLIRALESGYAPDYEELIKRYFDFLQQQEADR